MKILFLATIIAFSTILYGQEKLTNSLNQSEYSYQYALIEASRQKMIGNINEAINLYLSCISANPDCDVAYYELGTVYSALDDNVKAESMLSNAYNLNKENYWYGIAYSELLKQNKNLSKSLKVLRNMRKDNEFNSLTVNFKIAEILTDQGKYRKALLVLQEIERNNSVSELISFKKFDIYKLQKDYEKAENVINELALKAPEIVDYQIVLAEFYSQIGDSVRSLRTYEKAFFVDSSNIFAITNLADMYSSLGNDDKAFFYLNHAFLNRNIPVTSKIQTLMFLNKDRERIQKQRIFIEEMVKSLLKEYPDNLDVKTVAYDFYNGLNEHRDALLIIKQILNTVTDDYVIWQQAMYSASMIENYDELIFIGENALKYFPNKAEFYLFVGMAYFQKEDYEEAYSVLFKPFLAIKNDDKIRTQFLLFLSESAYKTNRKCLAYSYYDQLILADPANDFTKNNYSYYLALDSVNLLKAKELSYSTLLHAPENSTFLDTYAWILFKLGDYEMAKYYAKKALIVNAEKDSDIIFHYAEILTMLREFDLADKYYKLAEERGYEKGIIEKKLKVISGEF